MSGEPVLESIGDLEAGGRHSARAVALQVLYALDLGRARSGGSETEPVAAAEVFDRVTEHFSVSKSALPFARALVAAVEAGAEQIDQRLGEAARNWRVERMAAVDRNLLRIAIYELEQTQTPVAVVIDEAVDLARRFGSDRSPAFVNGVLDAIAKEVRAS